MPERLTDEQANLITAFTGVLIGDMGKFHAFAEARLGHDVYTHEMATQEFWAELRKNVADDFRSISPK